MKYAVEIGVKDPFGGESILVGVKEADDIVDVPSMGLNDAQKKIDLEGLTVTWMRVVELSRYTKPRELEDL